MPKIKWSSEVKLILSDVDETIADLYLSAEPEMIAELSELLEEGLSLFLITGHGLKGIQDRITDKIPAKLRKRILVSHCSGVEVWGFDIQGNLNQKPYYSLYEDKMSEQQRKLWRDLVNRIIREFELKTYPASPIRTFKEKAGDDPLSIMLEDRGPQITFEVINGYDLSTDQIKKIKKVIPETHGNYDLRMPIMELAEKLFKENNLPITPRLGGTFAIDFAVEGVSKTTSVKYILENKEILNHIGANSDVLNNPSNIEIWGDKFSSIRGGTDRHMCEAVDPKVRAIDFRQEDPEEFLKGYNIVVWDGKKHLHEGLLEYLSSRH